MSIQIDTSEHPTINYKNIRHSGYPVTVEPLFYKAVMR